MRHSSGQIRCRGAVHLSASYCSRFYDMRQVRQQTSLACIAAVVLYRASPTCNFVAQLPACRQCGALPGWHVTEAGAFQCSCSVHFWCFRSYGLGGLLFVRQSCSTMRPQLCVMLFNPQQVRVEASAGHDVSPARHDQPLKVATCCRNRLSNDSATDHNTIANAQAVPRAGVPATAAAAMQG